MDNMERCLDILELIKRERRRADEVNKSLRELDGSDFPSYISPMTSNMETRIVGLLDSILEPNSSEGIASYYLYECGDMKGGGQVIVEGSEGFEIKDIDDVRKYVKYINAES